MLSLPLNQEQQNNEWLHIPHVTCNTGVPHNLLLQLKRKIQHDLLHKTSLDPPNPQPPAKKKWATFTYTSPQIRKITNIFKHTDINIAFKYHNTIAQLSKPTRDTAPSSPYDKSGVYAIFCVTCGKVYVRQTSRRLNLRFKDHTHYIRYNNPLSAYTLHILQHQHEHGPIDQTMTLLKPVTNTSLSTPMNNISFNPLAAREDSSPSKTLGNRTHCSN
jgi:hypothetical protein